MELRLYVRTRSNVHISFLLNWDQYTYVEVIRAVHFDLVEHELDVKVILIDIEGKLLDNVVAEPHYVNVCHVYFRVGRFDDDQVFELQRIVRRDIQFWNPFTNLALQVFDVVQNALSELRILVVTHINVGSCKMHGIICAKRYVTHECDAGSH